MGAEALAAEQEGLQAAETENMDSGLENTTNAAKLEMRNTLCKRCLDRVDLTMMPVFDLLVNVLPQRTRRSIAADGFPLLLLKSPGGRAVGFGPL